MENNIYLEYGPLSSEFKPSLNVQYILLLIREGKQAEKLGCGKVTCLFLGPTGCGKSTTINLLLGKKMIQKQIESDVQLRGLESTIRNKIKVIVPEYEKDEEFKIGHSKESQTISLQVAQIPNYDNRVLCDSPGFFDSRCVEVEIANSVCLKNFIQKCKSVRPIVLIRYQDLTAAKGDLFKKLFDLVINILDKPGELNFSKFLFFYTHMPPDKTIDDIQSEHINLYEFYQKDFEQNQSQLKLLSVLLQQIKQYNQSLILKPLENNREEYLQLILKQSPFENPSTEFTLSTSEKANKSLQLYSQEVLNQIEQWMKDNQYKDTFELLKTFQQLKDLVQNEILSTMYNRFLVNIKKNIETETDNILIIFRDSAKTDNFLAQSTIEKILFITQQLFIVDQYKTLFYRDFQLSQDSFLFEIKEISNEISQSAIENFCQNIQITQNELIKLKNTSKKIEQIKEIYDNCKKQLFELSSLKSNKTIQSIEDFFLNKNIPVQKQYIIKQIDEFVVNFQVHQQIEKFLSVFYENDNDKLDFYNKIIDHFGQKNKLNYQNLAQNLHSIQKFLKDLLFEDSAIQLQNNVVSKDKLQENSQNIQENRKENHSTYFMNTICIDFEVITLKQLGEHQQVNQYAKEVINDYEKAKILIQEFVEFAFKNLQFCYEEKSQLKKMQFVLKFIDLIRKLDETVYTQTQEEYNKFKSFLEGKIKKKKKEAKSFLNEFLEEQMKDFNILQQQKNNLSPDKKLKKISSLFDFLQKMRWADSYFQRNMCEKVIQNMNKQLTEFIQQCVNKCQYFTENNEFTELYCFLQILENLQIIEKEINTYREMKDNCHIEVQKKVMEKIQNIQKQYNQLKESKMKYELNEQTWVNLNKNLIILKQIDQLKQIPYIRTQANILKQQIESFLQTYYQENYDHIQQNFALQKIINIIEKNELRKWTNFINNIFLIQAECPEILGCFGKNQKPQKLNDLISQIYDYLVENYEDKKLKSGDLQQITYMYEKIKQFTNEFRNSFQHLFENFKTLLNPKKTVSQAFEDIQKHIRKEEYDTVNELLNKIINLKDPQDQVNLNSLFQMLYSQFESSIKILNRLIDSKKQINDEFISSVKHELSRIESILKVYKNCKREVEENLSYEQISKLQNQFNNYIVTKCDEILFFAKQIELKTLEENYNSLYQFFIQINQFQFVQINTEWSKNLIKSVGTKLKDQLQIMNIKSPDQLITYFQEFTYSTKIQNSAFFSVYYSSKEQLQILVNLYFENQIQQIENQIRSEQSINLKQKLQKITKHLDDFNEKAIPFDLDLQEKVKSVEQQLDDSSNQIFTKILQQIENKDCRNKIFKQLNEIKTKNTELYEKFCSKIKKEQTKQISQLNEQYTQMNNQEFKECLQKTCQFQKYFGVEITEQFQGLINNLIQKSIKFLNQFDEILQNLNLKFENEQQIIQFFKHSQFLQYLREIDDLQQNTQINELLQRFQRSKQLIMDLLNKVQNDQQRLLELHQYNVFKDIKKQSNKFDLLIKCFQECNPEKQKIYQEFIQIGQKVMTFEQLSQRVQEQFSINESEIQNILSQGDFKRIRQIILETQKQKILNLYFEEEIINQNQIIKLIEDEISNMTKSAMNTIQQSIQYDNNLNILINKIYLAEEVLKDINGLIYQNASQISQINNQINKKIDQFIQNYLQQYKKNDDIDELVTMLINIQDIGMNIKHFSQFTDQKIDQTLQKLLKIKTPDFFFSLGVLLQSSVNGAYIVNQQPIFTSIKQSQYNSLVGKHNKEYILQNLKFSKDGQIESKFSEDQVKTLSSLLEKYKTTYDNLINQYQFKKENWKEIIVQAKQEIKISGISLKHWDNKLKQSVPKILACICAYWTLTNSAGQITKMKNSDTFKKPNDGQIIDIFILLGFEEMDNSLKNFVFQNIKKISIIEKNIQKYLSNRLIQIQTGEGKSLILGFCSILLALLGCSIDVVCYSTYLSNRDFQDFLPVIMDFGVENKIQYGNFKQLSENIINSKGDIREFTNMRLGQQQIDKKIKEEDNPPKILIFDEVDVFFDLDFLGKTYNPATSFKTPEVEEIIRKVWDMRNKSSNQIFKNIQTLQSYTNLQYKYPKLIQYFDSQIKTLSKNVKDVEIHEQTYRYTVKNNQIGYKELDSSYSFSTHYEYHTLFAYFHKNQQKLISDEALVKQLRFNLNCGHLSYALIPQNNYVAILGVSGTLKSLNPVMKQVLKKYNFQKEIYAPSMFGQSNRDFREVDMVKVENDQDNQYIQIQSISNAAYKNKQSVLIFFKDKMEIDNYLQSQKLCIPSDKYILITEDLDQSEINFQVRKSTLSQNIALCVREYGRGTDFICLDPEVEKNGGVVVIQTFLSKDKTEEIQIMGRSARQAKKGQYYLILNQKDLEKEFNITKQQIEQWQNNQYPVSLYRNISNVRDKKQDEAYLNIEKQIEEAKDLHEKTLQYYDDLYQSNYEKIYEYIISNN